MFLFFVISSSLVFACPISSTNPVTGDVETRDCTSSDKEFWNPPDAAQVAKLDTTTIKQNWQLAKEHQEVLTDTQINALDQAQIKELSHPDALKKVKGNNGKYLNSEQLTKIGGLKGADASVLPHLTAAAIKDHLTKENAELQRQLNPQEYEAAARLVTGIPLTIKLGTNGIGGTFTKNGFEIKSAESLGVGNSIITQGTGIEYKEGKLSVRTAESFVHNSDARGFNATDIETTAKGFSVNHAEEIRMFCHNNGEIVLQDLNKATVYDQDKLILQLDKNSTSEIKDCNGNTAQMTALSDSATLIMSKDGKNPEYFLTNVSIDFSFTLPFGFFTENITARDPTYIITHKNNGIYRVQGTDAYDYFFNDPNSQTQWKFRGKSSTFFVQVRKTENQSKDFVCTNCVLFDLIDHRMYLKGALEVMRQLKRSDGTPLSNDFHPIIEQTNEHTNLTVQLNQPNTEMLYTYLTTDTPTVSLYPSTYLSIHERIYNGQTTRFFGIYPQDAVSDSIIHKYSTIYSPYAIDITHNNLIQHDTSGKFNCTIIIHAPDKTEAILKGAQTERELLQHQIEERRKANAESIQ